MADQKPLRLDGQQLTQFQTGDTVPVANGGTGATDAAGARAALGAASTAHKDTHKSGGSDALTSSDLMEAVVKRLRESGGPTDLTLGAVADGEVLKRSGSTIVGGSAAGGSSTGGTLYEAISQL